MIAIDTRTITQAILNQWSPVSWDEFLRLVDEPTNNGLKGYYYNVRMRLEVMSTGSDHSNDHHILIFLISLFATLQGIPLRGKDVCSYRKTGISEFQPVVSYYLGDRLNIHLLKFARGDRYLTQQQISSNDLMCFRRRSMLPPATGLL